MEFIVKTDKFIRAYNSIPNEERLEVEQSLATLDEIVDKEIAELKPQIAQRIEKEVRDRIANKYAEKRQLFEQFLEISENTNLEVEEVVQDE